LFRLAYISATSVLGLILPFVAVFSSKVKAFSHHRKTGNQPDIGEIKYWIHCASLGEYEMALPLIERLLTEVKIEAILITFFSPSGYTQAIKGDYANRVMYLPLDIRGDVRSFYNKYKPQKAILVRYDFWYNLISEGQKRGVDFYLINGRFKKDHFLFQWYGKAYVECIKIFKGVFTSDEHSAVLLRENNVAAEYTGDTRFDRVNAIAERARKYQEIEEFKGSRKLLMVGSSWEDEESLIIELLKQNQSNLAIIIAPHDLKRVASIVEKFQDFDVQKYSEGKFTPAHKLLILDTMGMLSAMYQYADFALIGGGFRGALHNILEPAVWGCHISFGPNTTKFPEARAFEVAEFALQIRDSATWVDQIAHLLKNNQELLEIKQKSKSFAAENIGATRRILTNMN